jgi:hypothetical protein
MRKLYLLLMGVVFFASQAMAQRTITGKVTDDNGAPLANISVLVKGTTVGTSTKADGTYSLNVPANGRTLVFSSVDMLTVEVSIGAKTSIDATLLKEDKTMQEVVVVGYGTQRKKEATAAISKIDPTNIAPLVSPQYRQATRWSYTRIKCDQSQWSGESATSDPYPWCKLCWG